ncbi:MAG: hypothetical protein HY608_04785 [Planctomycetes bacterium]|nr:hypothetical protein [Planctomycetota bacterium]
MLHLAVGFLLGAIVGFLTALLLNVHFSLRGEPGKPSPLTLRWVRMKIFVLSLWERKFRYVVVVLLCILVGLWIGSLSPTGPGDAPDASWADRALNRLIRAIARDWGR